MVKVLILTHGGLASSLYETLGQFIREREGLEAFGIGADTAAFRRRLVEAVVESPESDILLLVDLFGGSPFNMAAALLGQAREKGKRVEIISGVNLPMLLEITPDIPHRSLEELKRMAFDIGRQGVRDLMAELSAKKEVN